MSCSPRRMPEPPFGLMVEPDALGARPLADAADVAPTPTNSSELVAVATPPPAVPLEPWPAALPSRLFFLNATVTPFVARKGAPGLAIYPNIEEILLIPLCHNNAGRFTTDDARS